MKLFYWLIVGVLFIAAIYAIGTIKDLEEKALVVVKEKSVGLVSGIKNTYDEARKK